ncbi:flavodoxin family protein [Companilactobacillus jidongensis]|uniref:flavodoxin family protein n=1 Tax=Companilactobacillus jidongensis TaxID=2486006 RepID=UPI001CDBB3B6|nr:flavodoxin [Companilactobacillus jidongensis]
MNKNLKLGPIVGKINEVDIYANQLMRKGSSWAGGGNTPSDGNDTNINNDPIRKLTNTAKSIVIYWSRSGSTELLASKIINKTNSDIFEITVKDPYPANYVKTRDRANFERESNTPPELDLILPDLSQYDTVFLGFQTWAMTLSQPMKAFLLDYGDRLSDKRIAPFETQGGYGSGDSIDLMKEILNQNNTFTSPLIVDGNRVDDANSKVERWVEEVEESKI